MVPVNHRQSRHSSWSPFVALDRGFRMLFVREPTPTETATLDLEVSFQFDSSPHNHQGRNFQIAIHTETNVDISSLNETSRAYTKKGKARTIQFT